MQIPLGEYNVVSAFTSEDSFICEATTKTEQFTLKDGYKIEVTVTHNPEGEEILANLNQDPVETSETMVSEPADGTSTETVEPAESPDSSSEPEESETQGDGEEEEANSDVVAKAVKNILLTLAVTLVFLVGTVLFVMYVRFKFGSD